MPDPAIPRVPRAQMNPRLQQDYDAALELRDDATLIEIGAHAPELMEWYRESFYAKVFYGGRVDVRTKELLRYRLSMTHGCAYCNRGNSAAARKSGVTEEQLARVMDETDAVFDARDRAVLKLADQVAMTNQHGHLDRALADRVQGDVQGVTPRGAQSPHLSTSSSSIPRSGSLQRRSMSTNAMTLV